MRRRIASVGLALLAALLLVGLGGWQVQRLVWKRALIERVETRLAAAPVALPPRPDWPRLAADGEYSRLRLSGRWLAGRPAFVQAVTAIGPGWWVMSALRTPEGTIVVNRGFVPSDRRAEVPAATGHATVTGLLRRSEPQGAFLRRNDPGQDRWYSRDVTAIARARGWDDPAPFFIDAGASGGGGWPRGGMTVVRFPNNHLIYAITWFSLAGLALWFAWRAARMPAGQGGEP